MFSDAAELVLIIEAPLSAAFDIRQNPMSRGTFESSPRPRWWSLGAGAAMALAAHHFLRGIMQYSTSANRVHVLEGFVVGADSVEHDRVAGHLLDCFLGGVPGNWVTPQGAGLISSLSWADPSAATECPLILCPSSA